VKFHSQKEKLPAAAPYYELKVGVPTFEFGAMHAILLQLALLPLTMCRYAISGASNTIFHKFIDLDGLTKYHIGIGYCFVALLFGSTMVFICFFGFLCSQGEDKFCKNFQSEIMITGYVLFTLFMTVGVSSYLRFNIPYKIFYAIHHITIVAYILCILHTIDTVERSKGGRSQAFKWFSASIIAYICDRATMYLSQRYNSTIMTSTAIESENKEKIVILKVKKPALFSFAPGQYAYLRVPGVDQRWHPFSIASSPELNYLNFYIKVCGDNSWTDRLYKLIVSQEQGLGETSNTRKWDENTAGHNRIEVMGPYGTSLGDRVDYSHALLVGSGTGFVPCMSILCEHIDQCVSLEPTRYKTQLQSQRKTLVNIRDELTKKESSVFSLLSSGGNENKASPMSAKRKLYWHTLSLFGPLLGLIMVALNISWNSLPFDTDSYVGMDHVLSFGTVAFQLMFFLLSVTKSSTGGCTPLLDLSSLILCIPSDWYWFSKDLWGHFEGDHLLYYSLLMFYQTFRFWYAAVGDISFNTTKEINKRRSGLVTFEKVRFVWISRSTSFIEQVYPDLEAKWEEIVNAWGLELAREAVDISIFCTSKDRKACQNLTDLLQDTKLYSEGSLNFGRPSIQQIVEENTTEIIEQKSIAANTLFAFCGSDVMGRTVKKAKIYNDMWLSMMGKNELTYKLVVQSYGGLQKPPKSAGPSQDNSDIVPAMVPNVSNRMSLFKSITAGSRNNESEGVHEKSFIIIPDLRKAVLAKSIVDRSFFKSVRISHNVSYFDH